MKILIYVVVTLISVILYQPFDKFFIPNLIELYNPGASAARMAFFGILIFVLEYIWWGGTLLIAKRLCAKYQDNLDIKDIQKDGKITFCRKCGNKLLKTPQNFCENCKTTEVKPTTADATTYCSQCKHVIHTNSIYCPYCGLKNPILKNETALSKTAEIQKSDTVSDIHTTTASIQTTTKSTSVPASTLKPTARPANKTSNTLNKQYLPLILSVGLIIMFSLTIILLYNSMSTHVETLEATIESQENRINTLVKNSTEYKRKLDFYESRIGVGALDSSEKIYHVYGCYLLGDDSNIGLSTIKTLEAYNYAPCSWCIK